VIFAGARPLTNPQKDTTLSWAGSVLVSLFWVSFSVLFLGMFLFGTTLSFAGRQPNPLGYLSGWARESILEAILDY